MKKVIFRTIAILIIPIFICLAAFLLPPQFENTYMGELKYKYERLKDTPGKRIVIIGGSAMAFAIDSKLIEASLEDYKVVNMGMYAALGSKAVLDLSLSGIHEGDIVIFAPEQSPQTLSDYFGASYCLEACDGAYYMLPRFITSEKAASNLLAYLPGFALDKAKYFFTGSAPNPDSVYRKSAFNEYGDIADFLPQNIMALGYDNNTLVKYTKDTIDDIFTEYLNDYSKKISSKNATFLFAYAPANDMAVEDADTIRKVAGKSLDFLDEYHQYLTGRFNFPIIGNPHESLLDASWFYDTNYHLNSYGKTLYTRQLIRDLKAYLKDCSETLISVPKAPEYNYDKDSSQKTVLKAESYSGNTDITSITIDEAVTMIEDYSFFGCTSLKEIHIKNADPSKIQIGQHLLDGTNANIYVPTASVSLYKTDYRFSVYAERIYGESE